MQNKQIIKQQNVFELVINEPIKNRFNELAANNKLKPENELHFAMQALTSNDFAMKVAMNNKQSLENAVINIAALGISLNPAEQKAYLVPRDGKIILDISYRGLIYLAYESGSITYVDAALVYENDDFIINGIEEKPTHKYNPFDKNRGKIIGVYCVAKLKTGEYLTTIMSIDDVYSIRNRSVSYKAVTSGKAKSCPWTTDEGEMIKKTVIKRAFKLWPKNERIAQAVEVLNIENDEGFISIDNSPTEPEIDYMKEYEKKNNALEEIQLYLLENSKDMTLVEKCTFIKEQFGVNKFDELKKLNIDELNKLLEKVRN